MRTPHTQRRDLLALARADIELLPGRKARHDEDRATRDPIQIAEWAGRWPSANWSVILGGERGGMSLAVSGFPGLRNIEALERDLGILPATAQMRTAVGSIRLFRAPGAKLVGREVMQGISTRASLNGRRQALELPSPVLSNGLYWLVEPTEAGVAILPAPWLAYLLEHQRVTPPLAA